MRITAKPESLLDVCMHYGIPLEHACGGSCACTTCHVIVKQGDQNLSEMDDDEADRLEMAPGLTIHSRLGLPGGGEGRRGGGDPVLEPQLRQRRRRLDQPRRRDPATEDDRRRLVRTGHPAILIVSGRDRPAAGKGCDKRLAWFVSGSWSRCLHSDRLLAGDDRPTPGPGRTARDRR